MAANWTNQSVLTAGAEDKDTGSALWWSWTGATLKGGMLGALLGIAVYFGSGLLFGVLSRFTLAPVNPAVVQVVQFVGGTLFGLEVGAAQGRVLRGRFGARVALLWARATGLGVTLACVAVAVLSPFTSGLTADLSKSNYVLGQFATAIIFSVYSGLIIGSLQCAVLWSHARMAAWWPFGVVVALAGSTCIALGVTLLVIRSLFGPNPTIFALPFALFIYVGSIPCITWPFTVAITGLVLVWLLKKPGKVAELQWTQSTATK